MARQAEAERERRAKVIHASGNKKPPPRSHPARRITIRPEPARQFGSAVNLRVALLGTYPPTQCGLATYLASTRSVLAWARPAWSMPVIRVLGSAAAGPQAAPGVVATWRPGCRSSLFEAAYEIATTECPCWCGLTVPHEDPVAMSEAIGSIVADPVRARRMSRGAHHVGRPMLWSAVAESTATLIDSIVNARNRECLSLGIPVLEEGTTHDDAIRCRTLSRR